jgi:hypothetical protein
MKSFEVRFWEKVDVGGPDECWPWKAAKNKKGYGLIGRGRRGEGNIRSNRAAWELTHGEIPDGMLVCHICDNPPCCNPKHLFLGTPRQNHDDKVAKGNQVRGVKTCTAKLTPDKVRNIRFMYATGGYTQKELARLFNVTPQQVGRIVRRERWKHIH